MLKERITDNLKEALKNKDVEKTGVLRMLIAALHNKEIEKKGKGQDSTLTDDDVVDVLLKEAKKRKESSELYKQGNREDLAQKELKELEIIQEYLPKQLSEQEIEKIVSEAIEKTGASSVKDMGKVMGEAAKETKGRADSKTISDLVKKKLGI